MRRNPVSILAVLGLVVGLLSTTPLQAYQLPSVNLGSTTFLDGGPPAGPGFYFTNYLQYWVADEFKDQDGDAAFPSFADEELTAWINIFQLIYQSDQELLFGGKWGCNFMLPFVSLNMDYGVPNTFGFPEDKGSGFGDLLIGPHLQWGPIMGKNGPILMHRIELQMILPTGKYDDDKEINPGSNFFSFNPYWSATLFVTPKLTTSIRFHYLWNAKNHDPNRGFVNAGDTQAGQAIHFNFTVAYEILPRKFRIGLNTYYLKQISDTEVDGDNLADSKEQVLGIGPGVVYHFSQDNHLFLNVYFETEAENRPKGERFNLRFVHHF